LSCILFKYYINVKYVNGAIQYVNGAIQYVNGAITYVIEQYNM